MQKLSPFKTLIKGSLIVFSGNILINIIGFIYQIPVVRILGPEKYGLWGLVYSIISTVAYLTIPGLGFGILYFLSKRRLQYNDKQIGAILKISLIFVLVSSLIFTVGLLIFNAYFIEKIYRYPDIKALIYIMSLSVPLMALVRICGSVFRGLGNAYVDYKTKLLPDIFKLCMVPIVLLLTDGNLLYLAVFNVLAISLSLIYSGYFINKLVIPLRNIFKYRVKGYTNKLVSYSWPLSLNEYIAVAARRIDIFFIAYFLQEYSVGVYRIAAILPTMVMLVPTALNYLLFPILNKLVTEKKVDEYIEFAKRTYKYMLYLSIPIICFFVLFSGNIITIIYGYKYISATRPLIFLTVAAGISMLQSIPVNIMALNEKTKSILVINTTGIITNIVANYFLIPKYAITGAAIATLLGNSLIVILAVILSGLFLKRVIFPWRSIGILMVGIIVIFISIYFRQRSITCNIAIYIIAMSIIAAWGKIYEKDEIQNGWNFIKSKININTTSVNGN